MTQSNPQDRVFLMSDAVLAKLKSNAAYTERLRGPEVFSPVSCALSMLGKSAGQALNHRLGWAFYFSWDKENPTSMPASTVNAALLFCESLFDAKPADSFVYPGEQEDAPPLATDWDFTAMPNTQQRAVCREIVAAIVASCEAFCIEFGIPAEQGSAAPEKLAA